MSWDKSAISSATSSTSRSVIALRLARTYNAEDFFRRKLSDVHESTAPFGLVDIHENGNRIEEARQTISRDLSKQVLVLARHLGVSAATLFHAAWALVVASTSGRDDVVFGTVLLGRLGVSMDVHRSLGMFINTLPIRLRLLGVTARELVSLVPQSCVRLRCAPESSVVDRPVRTVWKEVETSSQLGRGQAKNSPSPLFPLCAQVRKSDGGL